MRNGRKSGTVLMTLGILLVLASLGLAVYNNYADLRADRVAKEVLERFPRVNNSENGIPEYILNSDIVEIPDYVLNPDMDMPVVEIDGNGYIGILEVPDLGLELSVMSELSDSNLKNAPCRYKGSVYKNNMIIAGHNYRAHFANLKNLAVDSAVKFTDADGNTFDYMVTDVATIDGRNIKEMESGEWDLTLFTCNYGGKARVAVRCELITEHD